MHAHLEVIMPPVKDVEKALESIMKPFSENTRYSYKDEKFWDWYVIGGRYAGSKFEAQFDEKKIELFYEWLKSEHITVSGFQFGKQTLQPSSQIEKVDNKWNEMFPSKDFVACPLFDHAKHENMPDDIQRLGDVPKRLTASRVIIATPSFKWNKKTEKGTYTGPLKAELMFSDDFYNGVSYQKTDWDKTVYSAIEKFKKDHERADKEYKDTQLPTDDWIAVTVDYHS